MRRKSHRITHQQMRDAFDKALQVVPFKINAPDDPNPLTKLFSTRT